MIYWGMENECAAPPDTRYNIAWDHCQPFNDRCKDTSINIRLGTDGSPREAPGYGNWEGLEFRTHEVWTQFPKLAVETMLSHMKAMGYAVTITCGLHFHFSGIILSPVQFDQLKKALIAVSHWKSRHEWVQNPWANPKYQPLRMVGLGHYEARVFNASNTYHGIFQPWLYLRRQIQKITNESVRR